MAAHSSILAWIIPWTKKPGGLPSMGSQKVGQDRMTKHSHILLLQGIASLEPSMRVSSSIPSSAVLWFHTRTSQEKQAVSCFCPACNL